MPDITRQLHRARVHRHTASGRHFWGALLQALATTATKEGAVALVQSLMSGEPRISAMTFAEWLTGVGKRCDADARALLEHARVLTVALASVKADPPGDAHFRSLAMRHAREAFLERAAVG